MNSHFNKGLLLTSLGSFWWGFIGVIYFEYVAFIGHIELVVHRCLWTAVMLLITTTVFSKWKTFLKEIKDSTPAIVFKAHNLVVTLRNKSQLNTWLKLYPEGTYTIN